MSDRLSLFAGKRVLVTGNTGFKGSWLALWLHELGAEVTGFAGVPATRLRLSRKGVRDLLPGTDHMLYGQTGSVFEALAHGVPVVSVAGDTDFIHDKLTPETPVPRFSDVHTVRGFLIDWASGNSDASMPQATREAVLRSVMAAVDWDKWSGCVSGGSA